MADSSDPLEVLEDEVPQKLVLSKGQVRDLKPRSQDVVVGEERFQDMDFKDMQLSQDIIKGLKVCRYDKPTPIQLRAIPLGQLHFDLLLQAKSGTGKTCVFTVCLLQQISIPKMKIQGLVITPCRELAVQVCYVMKSIGAFMDGLKVKEFIGGTSVAQSVRRLSNCHVAVGTPGRLAHMVGEYNMDLSQVKVVALDEADKLLDPSFFDDIKKIFKALSTKKQIIATSATYSDNVIQFLETFMKNVCKIQLDLDNPSLCGVDQYMVEVKKMVGGGSGGNKKGGVKTSAENECFEAKFTCLREIMGRVDFQQAIIFSNYQLRAEKIYDALKDRGLDVDLLSAARSQEDRILAFLALQQGKVKALVATDVASRGIDIEGVDIVINFDIPHDKDTYIHRIGRAGRFGAPGKGLSLCYFDSDKSTLAEFQGNIHFTLWVIEESKELLGLNEETNEAPKGRRQLRVVPNPSQTSTDPQEILKWKEICERILVLNDEDSFEVEDLFLMEPSKDLLSSTFEEVKDEIDKWNKDFQKKKVQYRVTSNNSSELRNGDEEDDDEVLEDDPFSSDIEEIDEEDEDEI